MFNPKLSKHIDETCKFSIKMPEQASLDSDKTTELLRNYESVGPGIYRLNQRTYAEYCFQEFPGYISNSNYGPLSKSIDIESEFYGLNYPNTKCGFDPKIDPVEKFKKSQIQFFKNYSDKKSHKKDCKETLIPIYTKNQKYCDNINTIQQNRFDYQLVPLEIQSNSYIGENTRLLRFDKQK
jgi:hypothetical protein